MKRSLLVVTLIVALGWMVLTAHAEMYSWIDENGVRHFSNTQPPQSKTDVKESAEVVSKETDHKVKKRRPVAKAVQSDEKYDPSPECKKSFKRCKEQWQASYESNVKLCEGDWSAAAEMGKRSGHDATPKEHYEACIKERQETRDKGLKSCERSYEKCMK